MLFLKFTADKIVKRLRWMMVGVILFDQLNTLLGQPSTFWQHPETANEANRFVHYFISRGGSFFIIYSILYSTVAFLLVSIVPRRWALVGAFSLILAHYYGASTWLFHRWHFGTLGPDGYGWVLGVIIVLLAFPAIDKPNSESSHGSEL